MSTKLKISCIFFGWLILSGYSPYAATQAAGCALQAAAQVLPPVMEAVDAGIRKGLNEIDNISIKSENSETVSTKPGSTENVIENAELKTTTANADDISSWGDKVVCNQAIQYGVPKWELNSNRYVDEALKRNLSEKKCVQLSQRFKAIEVKTASTSDLSNIIKEPLFKACPGTYKPSWNNCIGTRTYSDKAVYKGPWKSGKRHGVGTLTYSDGEKYVGSFKDGLHHGEGTITYPNGKVMRGIWENDKFKSERQ